MFSSASSGVRIAPPSASAAVVGGRRGPYPRGLPRGHRSREQTAGAAASGACHRPPSVLLLGGRAPRLGRPLAHAMQHALDYFRKYLTTSLPILSLENLSSTSWQPAAPNLCRSSDRARGVRSRHAAHNRGLRSPLPCGPAGFPSDQEAGCSQARLAGAGAQAAAEEAEWLAARKLFRTLRLRVVKVPRRHNPVAPATPGRGFPWPARF